MNANNFVENLIDQIETINQDEFKKNNYSVKKKIRVKKEINENPLLLKEYKANRIETLKKKNKLIKKENFVDIDNKVDIDIFNKENINPVKNSPEDSSEDSPEDSPEDSSEIISKKENDSNDSEEIKMKKENDLDFYELDKENKMHLIKDYMSRKKIYIEFEEFAKIDSIIDNNELLKKYISITKIHKQISKITFFKKKDDFSYNIDFQIPKKKNKISFFK